jgi:hypothetical protein
MWITTLGIGRKVDPLDMLWCQQGPRDVAQLLAGDMNVAQGRLEAAVGIGVAILLPDEMGVHGVLVYCADYGYGHSVALSADRWADDIRLSDIETPTAPFDRASLFSPRQVREEPSSQRGS